MHGAIARSVQRRRILAKKGAKETLLNRSKSVTDVHLSEEKRESVVNILKHTECTLFLARLVEGRGVDGLDASGLDNKSLKGRRQSFNDDHWAFEALPSTRPPFLSDWHYRFLHGYFKGEVLYDPSWFEAYLGFQANKAPGQNDNNSSWLVLRFNEFVLINQVRAEAAGLWRHACDRARVWALGSVKYW